MSYGKVLGIFAVFVGIAAICAQEADAVVGCGRKIETSKNPEVAKELIEVKSLEDRVCCNIGALTATQNAGLRACYNPYSANLKGAFSNCQTKAYGATANLGNYEQALKTSCDKGYAAYFGCLNGEIPSATQKDGHRRTGLEVLTELHKCQRKAVSI